MEKTDYARRKGLNESQIRSFLHYVHDDPEKRRILGKPSGRPSKVDNEITDKLIQRVITNENELTSAQIIKILQELDESITKSAAENYVYRTFSKKLDEYLKSKEELSCFGSNEERFVLVPLSKGASGRVKDLVDEHVNAKKKNVFSCDSDTYSHYRDIRRINLNH